jgi:hypothetical protein
MVDWGVPDWRDTNAYSTALDDWAWWWEFTRRSPKYRELWLRWATDGECPEVDQSASDFLRYRYRALALRNPQLTYRDAEAWQWWAPAVTVGGPTLQQFIIICGPDGKPTHAESAAAEKPVRPVGTPADRLGDMGYCEVAFDLRRPLRPQLDEAERRLMERRDRYYGKPGPRSPNKDLWPAHLRILDARDAGASWASIGDAFWPQNEGSKDRARARHKEAAHIREHFPL